jgi:hypothetical protein
MNNCPSCFSASAQKHISLGLLPCKSCQDKHDNLLSPSMPIEIIPDRIKAERQERGDSIEQPHLRGELNKKWLDLWGTGAAKERGFTDKEIKKAKYVYDGCGIRYYGDST